MDLVRLGAGAADARLRRIALLALPVFDDVPRLGFIGDLKEVARIRYSLQSENFYRGRRRRIRDDPAAIVKHRANLAKHRAADEKVSGLQRAVLHQNGGHRATALV